MIWIILFAIVGLFIGIEGGKNDSMMAGAFLGIIFGAVVGLLVMVFAGFIPAARPDVQWKTDCNTKIVALSDGTESSGHFFLFGGNVNSHWKFAYYVNDGGGVYHLDSQFADVTSVQEDATPETARICRTYNDSSNWGWWGLGDNGLDTPDHYTVHVPPGSIKNQFNLDLQTK